MRQPSALRLQARAVHQDAGLRHLLVESDHLADERVGRHHARLAVLGCLDQNHELHDVSPLLLTKTTCSAASDAGVLGDAEAERRKVEPREQGLARAEQRGRKHQVHPVHQPRLQVLAHGRDAAPDAHVLCPGGFARPPQGGLDPVGDKVEGRAARHLDRLARVVRQHEHRHVIRRALAPPPLPRLVGPVAADRAEHVAAEDPGADVRHALPRVVVVE